MTCLLLGPWLHARVQVWFLCKSGFSSSPAGPYVGGKARDNTPGLSIYCVYPFLHALMENVPIFGTSEAQAGRGLTQHLVLDFLSSSVPKHYSSG